METVLRLLLVSSPSYDPRHPGLQEGEKATGQGRNECRKYSQLSVPWVAATGGAGRGDRTFTSSSTDTAAAQNRSVTWHTWKEMARYLDEVWKMARLWLV